MKKKFLFVTIVSFAFLLGACGNPTPEAVAPQPEQNPISVEEKRAPKAKPQTEEIKASTLEELNALVPQEIDASVAAWNERYEALQAEIDTYDKYIANQEKMTDYYASVSRDMEEICIRMREYCVKYAQLILASEKPKDEKYDDLEELYDVVYDDAGEDIYDACYDGILDDIYDVYYDGILDDAYETAAYKEWADARSEEYENWVDARSQVYEIWFDFRSEVYEFWFDLRSEFWDGDMERAQEKIQDFQNDIEELKEEAGEKAAIEIG